MTITIDEWTYDPSKGKDVAVKLPLAYDPKSYKTSAAAAKGLQKALAKMAAKMGQAPSEVMLLTPEQSEEYGTGRNWRVIWEAGPYEWAIGASFQITGPWGYTEPYYSFDLCFTN